MSKILKFPDDFFWGTATSAYQTEGGIKNSDWSKVHPARKACNSYRLYRRDLDLMHKLGQVAYRFSIEWSRIEPEEGKFSKKEIIHYRKILFSLREMDIVPFVTLHHFTNPLWFAKKGGWTNKKSIFYFSRFARKVFEEYQGLADFWITINEPLIYAANSYLRGIWLPRKRNPLSFRNVLKNQARAHQRVYEIFHKSDPKTKIGIAKNNCFFEPFNKKSFLDRFSANVARRYWNERFLNKIKDYVN